MKNGSEENDFIPVKLKVISNPEYHSVTVAESSNGI